MTKRLEDGQERIIRPSPQFSMFKHKLIVVAEMVDCDTPYVNLSIAGGSARLTDTEALDLIDRLQRALAILPTSK